MPGFSYYLPAVESPAALAAAIRAAGLGYAFEQARPPARECHRGPDGNAGYVLASGDESLLGYYPERQTWRQIPGSPAWLGFVTGGRPTPEELLRRQPLPGHHLELADERLWQVPIARGCDDSGEQLRYVVQLPQRSMLTASGEWTIGGVTPRYEQLWEIAERFWERWNASLADATADDDQPQIAVEVTFSTMHADAIAALAANYRVGPAECDALGCLTGHHCVSILQALIDWPTISKWLKKKAASQPFAGSNSSAGSAAMPLATGPPSPTCGP